MPWMNTASELFRGCLETHITYSSAWDCGQHVSLRAARLSSRRGRTSQRWPRLLRWFVPNRNESGLDPMEYLCEPRDRSCRKRPSCSIVESEDYMSIAEVSSRLFDGSGADDPLAAPVSFLTREHQ